MKPRAHHPSRPAGERPRATARSLEQSTPHPRALEPNVRLDLERSFSADLRGIAIHDDPASWEATERRGLAAYTLGEEIHFGAGRFQPHGQPGKALLAHEVTHVLQQRAGRSPGHLSPGNAVAAEREARQASAAIATGRPVESASVAAPATLQGAELTEEVTPPPTTVAGSPTTTSPPPPATGAQPQEGLPQAIDLAFELLDDPAVQIAAGVVLPGPLLAGLKKLKPFLLGAWAIYKNPNIVIDPIKAAIGQLIAQIPAKVDQFVDEFKAQYPTLSKHLGGVWKHLKPKLTYLADNWWDVLKDTGRGLLFPWEGMSEDLDKIGALFVAAKDHFKAHRWSKFSDAVIDAWREGNNLAGRWYGWFLLAMALIGGILGAIFGAGVGFIPGVIAGAEVAFAAGKVLLISTVAAETANAGKAIGELAWSTLTDEETEDKYERIASSALTLGIIGVMFVIGEIASKFVQWLFRRISKAFRGEPTPPKLTAREQIYAERGEPSPAERLEADAIRKGAKDRLAKLDKGEPPRKGPEDDLGWLRDNPRRQDLAYDPDRGHFDIGEGKAAVAAEETGVLDGPLRRAPKGSDGDFLDAKNRLWSHKGGPDMNGIVREALQEAAAGKNVLVDLSELSPAQRAIVRVRVAGAKGGFVRFVPPFEFPSAAAPAGVVGGQVAGQAEKPAR